MIKDKLSPLCTIPFLSCLAILLINDFYLKSEYHNWITGKLSDVCGLFVFVSFWTAHFSERKVLVYFLTTLLFVFWKSPHAQPFINFFSNHLYPICRVVDITDLIALLILPITFLYTPPKAVRVRVHPTLIAILTLFAFCATSLPMHTKKFAQPQYVLFKSGLINIQSDNYPNDFEARITDSLLVMHIKRIQIAKEAELNDDFHKVIILRDLDLLVLKNVLKPYNDNFNLSDFISLRDSLTVRGKTSLTLNLDSVFDELNFMNTRLHGRFRRYKPDRQLIIDGRFKNGIEDSTWTFFNDKNEITSRKYFVGGELTRTEWLENSKLKSEQHHNTRDDVIVKKYFHLAILGIIIIGLLIMLISNFRKSTPQDIIQLPHFTRILIALAFPVPVFILVKLISSTIPYSYSNDFFRLIGEAILIFLITAPFFILIFYALKLRNRFDLLWYTLLFAFVIVFFEEYTYLKNLIY